MANRYKRMWFANKTFCVLRGSSTGPVLLKNFQSADYWLTKYLQWLSIFSWEDGLTVPRKQGRKIFHPYGFLIKNGYFYFSLSYRMAQ